MAQPDYVPVSPADRVRQTDKLPPARAWTATRPGEIPGLRPPRGDSFGTPGPDTGYALTLAGRFRDRVVLADGEHVDDVLSGAVGIAIKRAALFGRAPVVYDVELALSLFGYIGDAARSDLVEFRRPLFETAAHNYWEQRGIADVVPEETLRLTHGEVASAVGRGEWQSLVRVDVEDA